MVQALSLPYKTPHLVNFHSLSHRKEFKLMFKLENDTNQKSSTVIDSLKNSAALLHFLQLHELNSLSITPVIDTRNLMFKCALDSN